MRLFLLALALSIPAYAGHDETPCTSEAEAKWKPLSEAVKKAETLGHSVKVAEVHHKCYELRGKTKDGKRFELVFNPMTLEERKSN